MDVHQGFLLLLLMSPLIHAHHKQEYFELSDEIVPIHYELELTPYLIENEVPDKEQFTFDGKATIQFKVTKEDIKKIVLNSENLDIHDVHLTTLQRASEPISVEFKSNEDQHTLEVDLTTPLSLDTKYILTIEYSGHISEEPEGFYRYQDDHSTWIVSTKFFPNHARDVFPSFDDPKFKATFQFKINHHKKYHVYANTQVEETTDLEHDRIHDVFKITPKMSTHNIGLHLTNVQPYADISNKLANINFIVDREHADNVDFLNRVVFELLTAMDKYTDFPYSSIENIHKLDIVRLEDEKNIQSSWGLILLDPIFFNMHEDSKDKELLVNFLASEIAELWFGNLVTAKCAMCEFLDVALAEYVKHHAIKEVVSNLNTNDALTFAANGLSTEEEKFDEFTVLNSYAFCNSPTSLRREKNNDFLMRHLSKHRVPAFLRMMENSMGAEHFQKAIQNYLKEFAYDTADPKNLTDAFKKEWNTEVDFDLFINSWIQKLGFPLVTFTLAEDGKSFQVTQKEFFQDATQTSDRYWIVPVTYTTSNEKHFDEKPVDFFLTSKDPKTITLDEKVDWVLGNLQWAGYYRVNYDVKTWEKIGQALKEENFGGFDALTRYQILNNLFALGLTGHLDFAKVFEVAEYAKFETDNRNWRSYIFHMQSVGQRLNRVEMVAFGKYMQYLMKPKIDAMQSGYLANEEGNLDLAFANLCYYGDEKCIEEAKGLVDKYLTNPTDDITDRLEFAFGVAVYHDYEKYFDPIFQAMKTHEPTHLYRISCPSDGSKLTELMGYLLEHSEIQNNVVQITNLLTVGCSQDNVTFEFVKDNFNQIYANADDKIMELVFYKMAFAADESYKKDILKDLLEANKEKHHISQEAYDKILQTSGNTFNMFFGDAWKTLIRYLEAHYDYVMSPLQLGIYV